MSILIGRETRLIVQGITGKQGTKLSREMSDYGTNVVAGVTPGKGGSAVDGVPVYDTVAEAVLAHPEANASLVSVPKDAAKAAAFEAITSGRITLVNILTEGLPQRDAAAIVQCAEDHGVRVVGPASVGIINPLDRVKVGAIGGNDPGVFYPGHIAVFSKSGGMCLSIATEILNTVGYGTSIVVGVGGDRITGTTFRDLLELVRDDEQTALVILNGEIGGTYEEDAAAYIRESDYPKRVVARLTGIGAQEVFPRGSRMGHAGAIIGEAGLGSFQSKVEALEAAGVPVAKTSEELVTLVERAMPRQGPDFEGAVSEEVELVSISKSKLENLKSQIRAVNVRTALTRLANGMPHFRGYPLTDLIANASIAEMVFMALKKEDVSHEDAFRLKQDFLHCARHLGPSEATLAAAAAAHAAGAPIHVAVSAGLLALAEPDVGRLPSAIAQRYTPDQARALMLAPQTVNLVARLFGHELGWEDTNGIESAVFTAVGGRAPDAKERAVVRAAFVACIDHTPATPSSLAAVASYSGGNSLKTGLAAGISAMGDTHAGAGEGAARLLTHFLATYRDAMSRSDVLEADGVQIRSLRELAAYVVDKVTGVYGGEKRRIPGYGHRYYSTYGTDPRAAALLRIAEEAGIAGDCCALAEAVGRSLREKKSPGLCLNVDGAIGALLCDLGLPPAAGKALFLMPRTIGILGQLLEQRSGSFFRLSNDSIIYTGPELGERRRFE